MDDLRELYQTTILDHNRSPRNFGALEGANRSADGYNPLCGDKLRVYLALGDDDTIEAAHFEGSGCAISTASASLMTEFVKGRKLDEVEKTFERFHDICTGNPSEAVSAPELGKLAVFSGVREFPMRVKCATLAWHTLKAALDGGEQIARTE